MTQAIIRLLTLWVDGRGGRRHRALTADIELYNALGKELRNATGGVKLRGRIEASLLELTRQPSGRGAKVLALGLTGVSDLLFVVGIAVGVLFGSTVYGATSSEEDALAAAFLAFLLFAGTGLIWQILALAAHLVKRRRRRSSE